MKQKTVMSHISFECRAQLASLIKFSAAKEVVVREGFHFSFSEVLGATEWDTKVQDQDGV